MEILDWVKTRLASTNKLTLALIASLVVLLVWILWPRPETEQIQFQASDESGSVTAEISIHVVGEVVAPGLYQLPIGSRVSDAIDLAGGVSDNASAQSINLARILIDGEQIVVKSQQIFQQEMDSKISINDAAVEQLDELPGVGPSIAQKIVDYRENNGLFRSLEQLTEVSGIGPKMLENIKYLVRL